MREALALEVLPALTAVLGMQPLLSSTWGKDGTVAWWHMSEGELAADEDVLVVRALCFGLTNGPVLIVHVGVSQIHKRITKT